VLFMTTSMLAYKPGRTVRCGAAEDRLAGGLDAGPPRPAKKNVLALILTATGARKTVRAHRGRHVPGPDRDGRPVLHRRGGDGPQRADFGRSATPRPATSREQLIDHRLAMRSHSRKYFPGVIVVVHVRSPVPLRPVRNSRPGWCGVDARCDRSGPRGRGQLTRRHARLRP
jgi:hypothetical protein